LILAPTAPHLAEELWQKIGCEYSIHNRSWPEWNEALTREEEITLVVQVNGKLRDRITVPASTTEAEATRLAAESTRVQPHLAGRGVIKRIFIPGKLVNFVVK
jgi:leucyl-tRNA synthetase